MDDEIEYRYVKGKGWVAQKRDELTVYLGLPTYYYSVDPGTAICNSNGEILGHIESVDAQGNATIRLVNAIHSVTITGTVEF